MLIKKSQSNLLESSNEPGDVVRKDQLDSLTNNYYVKTKRFRSGRWENLDIAADAKSAWFSKEKIDELFKDNGCNATNSSQYGLKIFFGIHQLGILANGNQDIPIEYNNQQMVILVVTKKNTDSNKDEDQLFDDSYIRIAGYTGNAMDNGKLCPPQICN